MPTLKDQRLDRSAQRSRDLVRIPGRPEELQRPLVMFNSGLIPAQSMECVSLGAQALSDPLWVPKTASDRRR